MSTIFLIVITTLNIEKIDCKMLEFNVYNDELTTNATLSFENVKFTNEIIFVKFEKFELIELLTHIDIIFKIYKKFYN